MCIDNNEINNNYSYNYQLNNIDNSEKVIPDKLTKDYQSKADEIMADDTISIKNKCIQINELYTSSVEKLQSEMDIAKTPPENSDYSDQLDSSMHAINNDFQIRMDTLTTLMDAANPASGSGRDVRGSKMFGM